MRFIFSAAALSALVFFLFFSSSAVAQTSTVQEIDTNTTLNGTSLVGITNGPDGALWFAAANGTAIGRMLTSGGSVTSFPLPSGYACTGGYIASGPDGNLWFPMSSTVKGTTSVAIAKMTTGGTVTTIVIDNSGAVKPGQIIVGPDSNIWFTDVTGLGTVALSSGAYTHYALGVATLGIASGPDQNIWFTTNNAIARISTSGTGVTNFTASLSNANPPSIVAGSDGNLWFTGPKNAVGRITPSGSITNFPITTPTGGFGNITLGADGALWFSGSNAVGRITTAGAATSATFTGVATGITSGSDGAVWFAGSFTKSLTSVSALGRISTGTTGGGGTGSPTITLINPNQILVGSPATTLQIFGTNLLGSTTSPCLSPGQFVTFNGNAVNITANSATEIDVSVPANLLQQAGPATVQVSVRQVTAAAGCQIQTASSSVQISTTSGGGGGGGTLSTSVSKLFFNDIAGQLPPPETFSISTNSGSLVYGIAVNYPPSSAPAAWLNLSSTGGTVLAGKPVAVTVSVSQVVQQFAPNQYSASIVVTTSTPPSARPAGGAIPHAGGQTQTINVTLTVAPGGLTVTTLMVFGAVNGAPTPQDPQNLTVGGSGFAFTYSIQNELSPSAGSSCAGSAITSTTITTAQWLLVNGSTASGSGNAGQSLTVSVRPQGLSAGTYRADLNLVSSGVTYDVAIYLVVFNSPTTEIAFSYTIGGTLPGTQNFNFTSTCAFPTGFGQFLSLGASSDQNWLTVTATSVAVNAPYSVVASPVGLPVGTYNGTVIVSDTAGELSIALAILTVNPGTGPIVSALPHFAAQDIWTTGIFVINTSATQAANFSIAFYDDTGRPEALPFAGGATNTLTGTVAALGSAYYEASNPAGPLLSGWGRIASDPSIVIQALFRENSSGTYYEASVPSNSGSKEFEIPFDATTFAATGDPFFTGFAIANLDSTNTAFITCTARSTSGALIPGAFSSTTTGPPNLPPLGHWAGYLFPALNGFRGTVDCVSTTNIAATALRFIGSKAFSSLPVIDKGVGTGSAASAAIPHFAAQDVWTTGIFALNTSPTTAANFSITFSQDSGIAQPVTFATGTAGTTSRLSDTIPPLGLGYYETGNAAGSLISGWGSISADPSIVIQALFRENSNGTYYEAAVPSNVGSKEFVIPFDETTFVATGDQFFTGFAIANLDAANAAALTCIARDPNGVVINGVFAPGTLPPNLMPLGHWAGYNFPALAGRRGTIDCLSNTVIAATALHFIGNNAFSSLPVVYK